MAKKTYTFQGRIVSAQALGYYKNMLCVLVGDADVVSFNGEYKPYFRMLKTKQGIWSHGDFDNCMLGQKLVNITISTICGSDLVTDIQLVEDVINDNDDIQPEGPGFGEDLDDNQDVYGHYYDDCGEFVFDD